MKNNAKGNIKNGNNGFLPSSMKFISSCLKTASSGVRTASASVAASISGDNHDNKDQVLWASFDVLEVGPSFFKHVLLLGYSNGFQVIDVEDASNVTELVSRHDDPVTFLQMLPLLAPSGGREGFSPFHPLLIVVACDESKSSGSMLNGSNGLVGYGYDETPTGNPLISPTAVRFYSLRTHNYVHNLRFRSTVFMVRCSPRIVAVGLAAQIYCFDALTLENKFSVLTYPIPQMGGQGMTGFNIGYGPMAVGSRWLAYASNSSQMSNAGRLSPQNLTPTGVSPSTSPGNGSVMARYALESSKQLAAGLINLGDMSYKTLSKYYQDIIPDSPSSPISSNPGWKITRAASHTTETEVAGTVVVKDFVSRAVISQFRAHSSPISALCFDPSGTLLVTASIHGNNINIFRITPSCSRNGSGSQSYDLSSSHVHLYKLHRGMTSAVIQDICFSQYSQWMAIVSSRGTCHIFAISPFGGENVFQIKNSHADGPTFSLAVPRPWWFNSSFGINEQSLASPPPPPSVTLSVVSRIKSSNSGWLTTVSNVATSAVGKAVPPSGALAAVFHRSVPCDLHSSHIKVNALEYMLAYTPSGHVVQYKLLQTMGGETAETAPRVRPGSSMHSQEEDLRVRTEAVQAWDVCRRTDWPEIGDGVSGISLGEHDIAKTITDSSHCEGNDAGHSELLKPQEQTHLYLSNAEVQTNSGRIPVWKNSKISFHTLNPLETGEHNSTANHTGGEMMIDQVPFHEIDIRRKDLLPFYDQSHMVQSDRDDRGFDGGTFSISTSHSQPAKGSFLDGGSSRVSYPLIIQSDKMNTVAKGGSVSLALHNLDQGFFNSAASVSPIQHSKFANSVSSLTSRSLPSERTITKEAEYTESGGTNGISNISFNRSNLSMSMNILDEGPVNNSPDSELFFQEEYCKISPSSEDLESEVPAVMDCNNSAGEREKSEEDADNDDLIGGVFSFSE